MQITTLGPLALDGRLIQGKRLAAMIRELVDARGRHVSIATLVEAVWQGSPPEDATGAVQALVSRIRRLGLPVVAVAGGYRLPAERISVDAVEVRLLIERADAAMRRGDAVAARRWADEARALLPDAPEFVGDTGRRLLAGVAALRASAALAGEGPFDEADLRRLVAGTPPDEPSAALLVRILAAQGRDAEAYEVVEQLRAELAERYGKDLSPVVAQAHLALLRGELPAGDTGTPAVSVPMRRPPVAMLPAAWRRPGTALVGRERDVAALTEALAGASLVTVVAPGGAGKTRLAAEVARRVAAAGRPVRVVELAGVRSPDEVLLAVLAVIGGAEPALGQPDRGPARRGSDPADRLREAARDLDGLIVLDNCEHMREASARVVAGLFAVAAPDAVVLATSRAPLSFVGELVYPLRMLCDNAAVELLALRMRAGGVDLDLDRALELCHRLDNLPLALELAAARLRHAPIGDLLAGLTDRFGMLDDALRGLPERHASLRAMVDWSRELLAPADQHLLQCLAVLPGTFTAEAAAAVAGIPDARRGLAALVEESLLTFENEGGPPRYHMLETVREYCDSRIEEAGGRDAAMAGLVAWARAQAVTLAAGFIGPRQPAALRRCAEEQDNLVAALRWSIAHDDEPAAVDVAMALFQLWTVRGLHLEVTSWAEALLHPGDPSVRRRSAILHGREPGRPLPGADQLAWTCLCIGLAGAVTGSRRLFAIARSALRTVLAERPGDVSERAAALASALSALGSVELDVDVDVRLRAAAELIAYPDPYLKGFGMLMRASVRENLGAPAESVDDAERAYRQFEAAGDHWGMGLAAQALGERFGSRGPKGADDWLRRSERHFGLVGAEQGAIRVALEVRLAFAGDQEAVQRLREALTTGHLTEMDTAHVHLGLAQLLVRQELHDEALVHAESVMAMAIAPAIPVPQGRVVFRVAAALLYLQVATVDTPVASLLSLARADVLSSHDMPVLGCWALAGAALSAHRGEVERAHELWTLGIRLGANPTFLLPQGYGPRLSATLGPAESLATWHERPVTEATVRVHELMDDLLAGGCQPVNTR